MEVLSLLVVCKVAYMCVSVGGCGWQSTLNTAYIGQFASILLVFCKLHFTVLSKSLITATMDYKLNGLLSHHGKYIYNT